MYETIVRDFENTTDSIGSHFGIPFYTFVLSLLFLLILGKLLDQDDIHLLLFTFPYPMFFVSILLSWMAFSHVMLMTSMCHWIHGKPGLPDDHPINQVGFIRMIILFALVACASHLGHLIYDNLFGVPDFITKSW